MDLKQVALLAVTLLTAAYAIDWDTETALDTYVHSDDGYFSWEILTQYRYNVCTLYIVNMTSQIWQSESYVDHPIWWHTMGIAIPDEANITYPDTAAMFIDGGTNNPDAGPPDDGDTEGMAICLGATQLGIVGAYLRNIPNQPLVFTNDPTEMSRKEDSIIAWTWRTFLDVPDADHTVIARFPMTKAAKRGLDTIIEVSQSVAPYTNVQQFMAFGASKRGWTTWSLAATDQRVIAMVPMVFSLLNFNKTLMAHYQAMDGAWSFAFESYYRENLTQELLNPKAHEAFQYEDMYYYRERLTLPIFQIVSTGDEFFLCQDSHHWWDGIPDPKWTYMMENAEHTMWPHYLQMWDSVVSWFGAILAGNQLPTLNWTYGETATEGYIELTSDTTPETVTVFRAQTLSNDTRRDFRLAEGSSQSDIYFHPVMWNEENTTLVETSPNNWRATVDKVPGEWVAFLIRLMFLDANGDRMFMTTETNIIPDTQPAEPCYDSETCYSIMV